MHPSRRRKLYISIPCNVIDLGVRPYEEVWQLQKEIFTSRKDKKIDDTILVVEHPHTVTMGKSAKVENLLLNQAEFANHNIHLEFIDRGGDVTYHGPGQIVIYPILDLNHHFKDVHKYLRVLEQVVIDALKNYNIEANRIKDLTGVWVNNEKICAIGVKVSRWITMHGIAINFNTNLSYFDFIIPCGINDKKVTSLTKILGDNLNKSDFKKFVLDSFGKLFNLKLNMITKEKLHQNI